MILTDRPLLSSQMKSMIVQNNKKKNRNQFISAALLSPLEVEVPRVLPPTHHPLTKNQNLESAKRLLLLWKAQTTQSPPMKRPYHQRKNPKPKKWSPMKSTPKVNQRAVQRLIRQSLKSLENPKKNSNSKKNRRMDQAKQRSVHLLQTPRKVRPLHH